MSKIKIKSIIKSSDGEFSYEGFGIKNKNVFTYNDDGLLTKVIIDDIVTIERRKDYEIVLKYGEGKKLKGFYKTKYGCFKIETITKNIEKNKKSLKIVYDLIINDEFTDTFTFYFEYSIDS